MRAEKKIMPYAGQDFGGGERVEEYYEDKGLEPQEGQEGHGGKVLSDGRACL